MTAPIDPAAGVGADVVESKRALRRTMRSIRAAVVDREARTAAIWRVVWELPEIADASVVMAYRSIGSELDTAAFIEWCRSAGKRVELPDPMPDAAPPDVTGVDVVVVPGLAFTRDGHRLGQGGGWYDRVLVALPDTSTTIGVGFAEQLVDELPVEAHDVPLDRVVTDADG